MIGEILVSGLLIIGGVFGLVGSWGLIRLPDPMTRLHAPTKSAIISRRPRRVGSISLP